MSKKHEQRTRAEILAKRAQPIIEIPVCYAKTGLVVPKKIKLGSKYTPHQGAQEIARRVARGW